MVFWVILFLHFFSKNNEVLLYCDRIEAGSSDGYSGMTLQPNISTTWEPGKWFVVKYHFRKPPSSLDWLRYTITLVLLGITLVYIYLFIYKVPPASVLGLGQEWAVRYMSSKIARKSIIRCQLKDSNKVTQKNNCTQKGCRKIKVAIAADKYLLFRTSCPQYEMDDEKKKMEQGNWKQAVIMWPERKGKREIDDKVQKRHRVHNDVLEDRHHACSVTSSKQDIRATPCMYYCRSSTIMSKWCWACYRMTGQSSIPLYWRRAHSTHRPWKKTVFEYGSSARKFLNFFRWLDPVGCLVTKLIYIFLSIPRISW